MTCLRQSLTGSKLLITTEFPERLTEKGLPASLTLEMDINPATDLTSEWVDANERCSGYKYPEDVCKWFSTAIKREVIAIRAPMARKNTLKAERVMFGKGDAM